MRVPLSWLSDHVDIAGLAPTEIARRLTDAGLQVERVEEIGEDIGNVVIAEILEIEELTGFKKPIRWVTLTDGSSQRKVICGATNFAAGDLVAYARPPAQLPGGFLVERRDAYGHSSDGMICSARELGIGDDHSGIIVLGRAADKDLSLGSEVVEALGLRDTVLDISINPDRGYALSVRGVAREVATAFERPFTDPGLIEVPSFSDQTHAVVIEDAGGCDRYVMRAVVGLEPDARSPQWLKNRLVRAGMRPISLAVDVTNYVMLDLGQPLHAFDADKVRGSIVIRTAHQGESLRTLDGVDRRLDPRDLVIADDSGAIALAGVMGGESTEITEQTERILIESAHFEPVGTAYTARRHRLGSEASRRFERGADHEVCAAAAETAVALLVRHGGATGVDAVTDVDLRMPTPSITMPAGLPGRYAGRNYAIADVSRWLTEVGCTIAGNTSDVPVERQVWDVTPPPWRSDLRLPVDLVEEVVRLAGYADLPVTVPAAPPGRGLTRAQRQRRMVGGRLAAEGLAEVLTVPFVSDESADRLLLAVGDERRPSIRLANPVSDAEPWLRGSLLPGLLSALGRNLGRGFADVALFEIGPVFRARAGQSSMPALPPAVRPSDEALAALDAALPEQPVHAGIVLTGLAEHAGWWGPGRDYSWADAIEFARLTADAVGVVLDVQPDHERPPWHPGRCGALCLGDRVVAHAGELHPRVLSALALPPRVCAVEINLDAVLAAAPDVVPAPAMSTYPAATIDIAVVVDDAIPAIEVLRALRAGAGGLLESIRLFDVYRGDQLVAGTASYAFALRLRAPDRTLATEDVVAVRDAAVAEAARRVGAALRA